MPTVQVEPSSVHELQLIADVLGKSRKVVVVTGAGISTNCGIPDFRSENGLYSLIQAQYDAALKNPPWEHSNTFDIDDRPKKKRKQWFYEVVAPDGTVVDVIDEDLTASKEPQPEPAPRRASQSRSSDSTISNSRSSTPADKYSDDSSLSSCASLLSDPIGPESTQLSPPASQDRLFCPPQIEGTFLERHQVTLGQSPTSRRSSRHSSPHFDQQSTQESAQESTIPAIPSTQSTENSRPSSRASSLRTKKRTPLPSSVSKDILSPSSRSFPEITQKTSQSTLQRADSSFVSSTADLEEPSATQSSQTSRSLPNLKGRDLFDCMVWNNPFTTSIFYMFISSLRQKVQEVKDTSATHKFIRVLRDGGRLVRTYTQNIDLLEHREGLSVDLSLGPGSRGRFNPRRQRNDRPLSGGVECVLLHGSLVGLRCGLCASISSWDEQDRYAATLAGSAPDCPDCHAYNSRRASANRRGLAIGRLRPDIVLYGEEHPNANLISPLVTHDLALGPDVLLVMGTSLKVHGLKVMVREFAKAVHNKGGRVVFVNKTKPSESVWGDIIDYWVAWDCDEWVLDLKERRGDIWLPQGAVRGEEKRRESIGITKTSQKKARPQCLRDHKANGVYTTFKIIDMLHNIPDSKGRTSSRNPYWPPTSRQSIIPAVDSETARQSIIPAVDSETARQSITPAVDSETTRQPSTRVVEPRPIKKPQSLKKVSSKVTASTKVKSAPAREYINTKKRKSHPSYSESYLDDKENMTYKIAEIWARMKEENPKFAAIPLELKLPFSHLAGNMPEFFTKSFAFDGKSNHLPNVGGKSSLAGMNLKSLPPSDATVQKPSARPTNHSYGTRASRRWSAPEEAVADSQKTPSKSEENSDMIMAPGPMTPSSQRIKRISSIGNLVSSPEDEVEIWHDASEVLT